ncbi:MAG: hypothetical protein M3094_09845 [Actinomycetia bacterium]|nr:hypothetical protein [Actinomycetes bacterium]
MTREPVAYIAAIVGIVELIIPVLLAFGILAWTTEQTGIVMALVIGVGTILGALFTRAKVSPVEAS